MECFPCFFSVGYHTQNHFILCCLYGAFLKASQGITYTHDVEEESPGRLHAKCIDEVKRIINGTVEFEDAYRYQRRKN